MLKNKNFKTAAERNEVRGSFQASPTPGALALLRSIFLSKNVCAVLKLRVWEDFLEEEGR